MKLRDDFPLPDLEWPPTRPFWQAAAEGRLAIPRCEMCGRYVWYPQATCYACQGTRLTWTPVSGRGRLFTWVSVQRAFLPQFAGEVPFVPALVALAEDPAVRLVTRLVDYDLAALTIDMPVEVVFRPLRFPGVAREVMAPLFKPTRD